MTLEVLISTYNQGITEVPQVILPKIDNISWLVSFQYSDKSYLARIPKVLTDRSDIKICSHFGKGLSANRNFSIEHATGDILLIADDDSRYSAENLKTIIQSFENYPKADIILFQALNENRDLLRKYPPTSFAYPNIPKGYWPNSQEIAIRRSDKLPEFDTRFGINAEYLGCGEEEIFLWQCYLNGLTIKYIPIPIVQTSSNTTGTFMLQNPRLLRSKGAVLCFIYGPKSAILRSCKFVALNAFKANPIRLLTYLFQGIFYIRS